MGGGGVKYSGLPISHKSNHIPQRGWGSNNQPCSIVRYIITWSGDEIYLFPPCAFIFSQYSKWGKLQYTARPLTNPQSQVNHIVKGGGGGGGGGGHIPDLVQWWDMAHWACKDQSLLPSCIHFQTINHTQGQSKCQIYCAKHFLLITQ